MKYVVKIYIIFLFLIFPLKEAKTYDYQLWISGKSWDDYWRESHRKNNKRDYADSNSSWERAFQAARKENQHFFTYKGKRYNSFRGSEWRKITIQLGMNSKVKKIPAKYLHSALKGTAFKLSHYTYIKTPTNFYQFDFNSLGSSNQKRRVLSLFRYLLLAKKFKKSQGRYIKHDVDKIQFEIVTKCGQSYEDCQDRLILNIFFIPSLFDTQFSYGHIDRVMGKQITLNDISPKKYISGRSTMVEFLLKPIVEFPNSRVRLITNRVIDSSFSQCLKTDKFLNTTLDYFVANYDSDRRSANPFCLYQQLMRKVNL